MAITQKIVPNLWFDGKAEEAVNFYTSVFKNSSLGRTFYYSEAGCEEHKKEPGTVMAIEFNIEGQAYMALNGGPEFNFTEAVSFIIYCDEQDEVDYYWDKLTEGGDPKAQVCGWLKDKYGVSWQVVPRILDDMIADDNKEKSDKALLAMMKMQKLDIDSLKEAFDS